MWLIEQLHIEVGLQTVYKIGVYSSVLRGQSYEIKLPPWAILGFKILETFSFEN